MNRSSLGSGQLRRTLLTVAGLAGLAAAGAANATLSLTPATLTYAATQQGVAAAAQTITVKSTTALAAGAVTNALSGTGASSFTVTNGCTGALLANGTCTLTVTFKPASVGALAATLTVGATGQTSVTAALSGTGSSPLTATPATLSFTGTVGTATAAQTISVKSTAAIAGVAVAISGAGFTQSNTCATSLVANGTCAINVTYTASGTATATGTVTVSSTTTGVTAVSTTLSGSATAPIPAWETANTLGTQTAMFMGGPPMRYPGTTGVAGCGVTTTGGAYVHTTQGGDICAFASKNYTYSYDSSQTGTAYGDYYIYQAAAGTAYAAATDYFGFSVLAPYANANAAITPIGMANSKAMLIKLANMVTPSTTNGQANVVTVTIKNQGVTGAWPATNPAACSADVTLLTPATGTTTGPGPASFTGAYLGQASGAYVSQTGLLDYVIPFTAFTCSTNDAGTGTATTMAALQATGVTQVAVKIVGSKNPKVVAGSIDAISVGGISFQ
jgi:hypothetical protein